VRRELVVTGTFVEDSQTSLPPSTDRFFVGVVKIQMLVAAIAWTLCLCDISVAVVSQVLLAEGDNLIGVKTLR
jgi:hypothetical protein